MAFRDAVLGGGIMTLELDADVDLDWQSSILDFLDEWEFIIAPLIFTALGFFTRMWRIGLSNIVTWDEAQYVLDAPVAEPTVEEILRVV